MLKNFRDSTNWVRIFLQWTKKLTMNYLELMSPAQFAWTCYIGLRKLTRASICSVNPVWFVCAMKGPPWTPMKTLSEIVHCAEAPSMTQNSTVNLIRQFEVSIRSREFRSGIWHFFDIWKPHTLSQTLQTTILVAFYERNSRLPPT